MLSQCFLNEHVSFQGCSSRWVDELPPVPAAGLQLCEHWRVLGPLATLLVLESEELLPKLWQKSLGFKHIFILIMMFGLDILSDLSDFCLSFFLDILTLQTYKKLENRLVTKHPYTT